MVLFESGLTLQEPCKLTMRLFLVFPGDKLQLGAWDFLTKAQPGWP